MAKRIIIANPHGFCSGVRRAVETIEEALSLHKPPLYCLHEIVHNRQVVADLSSRGVIFVSSLDDVPESAALLFSAHGVSPAVRLAATAKKSKIIDATCPFVLKVHEEVRRFAESGCTVFVVGQARHDEVVGVAGEAPDRVTVIENEADAKRVTARDPDRVAVVCQTTLSAVFSDRITSILQSRFPELRMPAKSDVCYATQDRQRAAQALAKVAELILVLGSRNSANTRRLAEVAGAAGCRAVQVSDIIEIDNIPLGPVCDLGITSGASTPEFFLQSVIKELVSMGFETIENMKKESAYE